VARVTGLGIWFDAAWYCSADCLDAAMRARLERPSPGDSVTMAGIPSLRLGVLLTHQAGLPPDVLATALSRARRNGLRLGEQLMRMGAASQYEILRALAAQAGIGFLTAVDRARLWAAPGGLSRDAVRALGLVPFDVDPRNEVARVACVAPLPRLALGAMRQLTGFRIEPYLVADAQFPELLDAYGASADAEPVPSMSVDDVGSAAAHIVNAARTGAGLRMTETRCNDHVWVRLDDGARAQDLWLRATSV